MAGSTFWCSRHVSSLIGARLDVRTAHNIVACFTVLVPFFGKLANVARSHCPDAWSYDALKSRSFKALKLLIPKKSHPRKFALVEALKLDIYTISSIPYETMLDKCMQLFDVQRDSDCTG